ncbi:MAG: YfhO family protein [Chloroflexi bacterium]|nr:YfhO family protein [Chloroflexota bacterium]
MVTTLAQRRGFIPVTLGLLTFIFFWRVWFEDQALFGSDLAQIHYPLLQFLVRNVEQGALPLWNPHQFLGYSVVGNPQYGLFYPPNWLLLLFGEGNIYQGVGFIIGLHSFIAAWGMARLVRFWDVHPLAAVVAGFSFGFGGFIASRIYIGHYAMLLALAWMPWVLAGYKHALTRRSWPSTIPGGLALGLMVLAGHPQIAYLTGLALILLLLNETILIPSGWLLNLRQLVLMATLGALLSAVLWLPVIDYTGETARGLEDSREFANMHAVPPEQLLSIFIPDFFGNPTAAYWGEEFYEEMTAYGGVLSLIFLFIVPWRRGMFFLILILFGIVFSLGRDGLLYDILYTLIPPARGFRAPGRALILTSIGLAGYVGLGLTYIYETKPWRKLLLVACSFVLAAAIISQLKFDTSGTQAEQFQDSQILQVLAVLVGTAVAFIMLRFNRHASLGMLALLIILDVWMMSGRLIETQRAELSQVWQDTADVLPADSLGRLMRMPPPSGITNGASAVGLYSIEGYDPISPAGWDALREEAGPNIYEPASAINRVFGIQYVVSPRPIEEYNLATAQFLEFMTQVGDIRFYQNPNPLPRAYLSYAYDIEPDAEIARQRVGAGEVDRGDMVLLEQEPDCNIESGSGTVDIKVYKPNEIRLNVETDTPAILVLTDQYDDDWTVTVSGKRAELLLANTTFRGVCIPVGEHIVTFEYRPTLFYVGAAISTVTWLGLIGYLLLLCYCIAGKRKLWYTIVKDTS